MRDLTKKEKKLFDIFIKGYVEGLKGIPVGVLASYRSVQALTPSEVRYIKNDIISPTPAEADILDAYHQSVFYLKRRKYLYEQFKQGYIDGYFRMMSSELPRAFLDPELNEDIYKYLQSTWLHSKVYPERSETNEY